MIDYFSLFDQIPSDWKLLKLSEITRKIGSGSTPRGGSETYLSDRLNFAFIRSQNVFDRRFDTTGLAFITDEQAADLKGVWLKPNDILLNITGDGVTFSRACIVPDEILPACVNQHVSIIRVNADLCVPGYLLSYLTHPSIKQYIESFNSGGSRRAITKGHIESFLIPLPPISEQHAIAEILGSLDDKIELNRRMNETLQEIAHTIFKSWFVDFVPVHAKSRGEQPPSMDATTAFFPDHFEDSELGPIPAGWRVGTLGEIAENPRRSIQPQSVAPDTLYIGLEHMPQRSISLANWGVATDVESNKYEFKKNEFLFGKLRPYFHKVGIAPVDGICSTDILVITPTTDAWWGFILMMISDSSFIDYTSQVSSGTRMPRVSWQDISNYKIVIPSDQIASAFDEITKKSGLLIVDNIHQSQTLVETRDVLLPKLVSGEVRIHDLDNVIWEIA